MEPDTLAVAKSLAAAAGIGDVATAQRLTGGRNNRVFRVAAEDGRDFVLKLYHWDPSDNRDRLAAEYAFLEHAWAQGVRNVPQPLACDASVHAGLYGFVRGRRLAPGEVTAGYVEAALDFVLAVNRSGAGGLARASEACFSVAEHLATIERRVGRLGSVASPEGQALVRDRLVPAWQRIRALVDPVERPIGVACASPSDFGFHNALVDGADVAFLDFEYAGIDDPAKLACDFFCQPDVPVPPALFGRFVARLAEGLGLSRADTDRCHALLDAYRVKWACIMMNEFLPQGAARRAFANPGDTAERDRQQLARVGAALDMLEQTRN